MNKETSAVGRAQCAAALSGIVMLGTAAALLPAAAGAEEQEAWQFGAALYGYFPDIGGKATFPPTGATSDISVGIDKILDNLKMTFQGAMEARKGRWGGFTDLVYLDVGNTKTSTRDVSLGGTQLPADVTAKTTFDLKGTVWTLAATYRAVDERGSSMDLFAGARLLDVKQKLDWELSGNVGPIPLPDRAGNARASLSNWDGLVGVKGRFALGGAQQWFLPYYLDIGTGQSDLTWQGMAGVGYSFSWGEVIAAWRYLDYDMQSGEALESLDFNGPAIGAAFHW